MPKRLPKLTKEKEKEALQHFGTDLVAPFIEEGSKATEFKKGRSGNPNGRPVAPDSLTEVLALTLGKQGAKVLAKSLIAMATDPQRPNLHAIMYIYDRLEGKPRQSVEHVKEEENPFILALKELVVDDKRALEGRRVPSLTPTTTFSVLETKTGEDVSEESGVTVS